MSQSVFSAEGSINALPVQAANKQLTGRYAVVDYMSKDGFSVNLRNLEKDLTTILHTLEEAKDNAHEAGHSDDEKTYAGLIELVCDRIPDLEAMPPEPDPVADAQALLWSTVRKAQDLLRSEAERHKKETAIKGAETALREAFGIPGGLLSQLIETLFPGESPDFFDAKMAVATATFEDWGWKVYRYTSALEHTLDREPLRKLSKLLKQSSSHFLTRQVIDVLESTLHWCENTSMVYPSPISGKCDGKAPDGVLFPHIMMEMHSFATVKEAPAEWRKPLSGHAA